MVGEVVELVVDPTGFHLAPVYTFICLLVWSNHNCPCNLLTGAVVLLKFSNTLTKFSFSFSPNPA